MSEKQRIQPAIGSDEDDNPCLPAMDSESGQQDWPSKESAEEAGGSNHKWSREKWHGRRWGSDEWSDGKWSDLEQWRQHSDRWHKKRRYIFRRALRYLVLIGLLVLGGMAISSFLITRYFDGTGHTAALVWLTGCSLSLALPLMAIAVAMRGYRGFATPLLNVMAAADAVAAGDLTTRVPELPSGELGRLAKSFNHMATELERSDQ